MEKHIKSNKTFRYYVKGNIDQAEILIYVLHGYGQLAKFFIEKFKSLDERYFVVAPEGMHRFYLESTAGRVGASWMTKEDRENDITDNINWLSDLHKAISGNKKFHKIIVLGFSQGGATAARWYYKSFQKESQLILWACVFPPDLDMQSIIESELNENNYFILGNEDEYYTSEDQKVMINFYEGMKFKTLLYKGNHDINPTVLNKVLEIEH